MANWYYYNKIGEKVGPITSTTLKLLARQGIVTPETVVENNTGRSAIAGEVRGLTFPESSAPPTAPDIPKTPPVVSPSGNDKTEASGDAKDKIDQRLHQAVENNDAEGIAALINAMSKYKMADANINAKDEHGYTRLHHAASNNDTPAVVAFVKAGADVNAKSDKDGFTPLHLAALNKTIEAVVALIKAGANVDMKDNEGGCPLFYVAMGNATEVVDVLIKAGANLNTSNNDWLKPLHGAATTNAVEAIVLLTKAGADVNAITAGGETPLYYAARSNAVESIAALVKAGADINKADVVGITPLEVAKRLNKTEAIVAITKAMKNSEASRDAEIIKSGTNVNAKIDANGRTRLHKAAEENDVKTITSLIAAGADVNAKDTAENATPLHLAAACNAVEAISALVKAGANVNAKAILDVRPLHSAAATNSCKSIETLISAGADVNARNVNGGTPLDAAAASNFRESVQIFIASYATRVQSYATKLEKRSELASKTRILWGIVLSLFLCGFVLCGVSAGLRIIAQESKNREAAISSRVTWGLGLLMIIAGGGMICFRLPIKKNLQSINGELRPIFGSAMETFAHVRCSATLNQSACRKRGYVITLGPPQTISNTTQEWHTPKRTLRDASGRIIGTVEGQSELRDVTRTHTFTPCKCLNCGNEFAFFHGLFF